MKGSIACANGGELSIPKRRDFEHLKLEMLRFQNCARPKNVAILPLRFPGDFSVNLTANSAHCDSKTQRFLQLRKVLGQASAWNRFWRDFLEVWGVPKQTSQKFVAEEFCVGNSHQGDF